MTARRKLTFIVLSLLLGVASSTAQPIAQGSTGGTLGKTDQSLSGGQPKPGAALEPKKTKAAAPEAQKAGCGRIAGSWLWSNGLSVAISASSTATATNGDKATLTCSGGLYVFKWQAFGNEARMTLSADGKRLSGSGVVGPESAVRQ
jgi:hypothetical protein